MVGRSRSEAGRPVPGSRGNGDRLINLDVRGSRWDHSGSSACLAWFLTRLRFLGAKKVLNRIFRHMMNETEVLFHVAWPLERIVTQWALVFASLGRLFDVASQGGELGEGFTTGAKVGFVLALVGMLLQLVVVWEAGGACGACVHRMGFDAALCLPICAQRGRFASTQKVKKKKPKFALPRNTSMSRPRSSVVRQGPAS